ncbi:putative transposase [Nonomuraea soli]|uniref:Putative transposase n=1 Tax=Nonomuraea soli TaxID=1032476 RepID=A0A7W0CV46_9ACTN|nr:putative transposase [Nonomuraea soli]
MAVDRERRAATLARLTALRAAGHLSTEHVRLAASGLAVTERTIWRWLDQPAQDAPRRPGRAPYELSVADREAFAYFRGNIAAVHRARSAVTAPLPPPAEHAVGVAETAGGVVVPDFLRQGWAGARPLALRTLQEAFARQLTPAERAAWRTGEDGRRQASVYLTRPRSPRNHTWEADHKQLPIVVLPPRGPALKPWLTTVVDDGTRALLGWAIAVTPHTGTVLTAFHMALVYDVERGPFGAVPALVRIDRGLEFAAGAVYDVLAALCVDRHRLPSRKAYRKAYRKGKVERIHRTIDETLLRGLPGFTGGPRDAAGKLYGPIDDRYAARAAAHDDSDPGLAQPMRIERLASTFADWARWYNTTRPHRMLDGRTPLQAWESDTGPLHRVEADKLRHLLLAATTRVIAKDGIHFNNLAYIAPELQGRGGQRVEIRHMPHDDRFVEVYLDGRHLCTAHPAERLTPEQAEAFRAHTRAEARRLGQERRRATARARAELVPLTETSAGGPPAEARILPPATCRSRPGLGPQPRRPATTAGQHQPAGPDRPHRGRPPHRGGPGWRRAPAPARPGNRKKTDAPALRRTARRRHPADQPLPAGRPHHQRPGRLPRHRRRARPGRDRQDVRGRSRARGLTRRRDRHRHRHRQPGLPQPPDDAPGRRRAAARADRLQSTIQS